MKRDAQTHPQPLPLSLEVKRGGGRRPAGGGSPTGSLQIHGGLRPAELRALGLDPQGIIDFSANVNPLGPPPSILRAVQNVDYARYPDPDCLELREALASRLAVRPQQILIGNGATELIHLLARAFVNKGSTVTIAAPTFGEYEAAVRTAGGVIHCVQARAETDFLPDLAALRRSAARSALTFLCNPNNPTGVYLPRSSIEAFLNGLPHTAGPVVIDEAYLTFVDAPWTVLDLVQTGRVLLLRSMTKDYAIPGLRLGYLIAEEATVTRVQQYQVTWSVNAAAQAAGLAALQEDAYIEETRVIVRENKAFLTQALQDLGFNVVSGAANFLLIKVGDATAVRHRLLRQGIAVRDCTSFGLPAYIRVAVRLRPACERLLAALTTIGQNTAGLFYQ